MDSILDSVGSIVSWRPAAVEKENAESRERAHQKAFPNAVKNKVKDCKVLASEKQEAETGRDRALALIALAYYGTG